MTVFISVLKNLLMKCKQRQRDEDLPEVISIRFIWTVFCVHVF